MLIEAKVFTTTNRACAVVAVLISFIAAGGLAGCGDGGKKTKPKGNITKLENEIKKIEDPEQKARKFVELAALKQKAADNAGSVSALSSAADMADQIEDAKGKANVLNLVADAQARHDLASEAKGLLKKVQSALEKIEEPGAKLPILSKMAATYALIGNKDAAAAHLKTCEELAAGIEVLEVKISSLLDVAVAYDKIESTADSQRLVDQAFELARAAEDKRKQSDALSEIGGKLASMKKSDAAKAAFDEAEKTSEEIEAPESRAYALVTLAEKQIGAGLKSAAADTLKKALKVGDKISDASVSGPLTEKIAQLQAKTG
jgi:tetratricopeptide (TPR) repeat protein